jgi:GT2 family glycosyltransferase
MTQRLNILITCHNRKDKTLKCLKALYNQTVRGFEFNFDVFLVDDGSSDGTSDAVKMQYPQVRIIEGNGYLYWNGGMRLAWHTASKENGSVDYYLWLNDDTYLNSNALQLFFESIREDDNLIYVGATRSVVNNEITYSGYDKSNNIIVPNSSFQLCHHFNGNFVIIPTSVFEKLGNLSPYFSHALGDIDYGLRASRSGVHAYLLPDSIGYCEAHDMLPLWKDPNEILLKRIRHLYSPLSGCSPKEMFYFKLNNYGLKDAILTMITLHVRLFFPRLNNLC